MTRYRFIAVGIVLGTVAAIWAFTTFNKKTEPAEVAAQPGHTPTPGTIASNPFSPTTNTSPVAENSSAIEQTGNPKDTNVFSVVSVAPFSLSVMDDVRHYSQLQEYLQQLPTLDSQQIKGLVTELGDGFAGSVYAPAIITAAYQRWSEIDIDDAFDFALETSHEGGGLYGPPDAHGLAILSALDPDYTRTRIEDIGTDGEHSHLKYIAYSGIAQQDPERAVRDFLESGADVTRGDEFLYVAIEQWADQDPQAAWEFLQAENNDYLTSQFQEQILYRWLENDADNAMREIERMINSADPGSENMMLASLYTSHLLETDPDAAIQWAMSQSDPMVRENAIMSTLYGGGDIDPLQIQNLLDQLSTEEREHMMPMIAPEIARSMARNDPQSALAWVDQLSAEQLAGPEREHAISSVVSEWMLQNPDAAIDWITSQPNLINNKAMINNALYPAIHSSPEKSKQIFAKLSPELQMEMIEPMLSMRMGPDAREAKLWLSEQGNPDVLQVGTIMIEAMYGNADPITTLDKIVLLPPQSRQRVLFQFMQQQAYENESKVENWLAQTTALTQEERQIIQGMFDEHGPAVSYGASGYAPSMNIDCIPEY